MKISQNGLALIKNAEGFKSDAYLDTGGVPTIGYGTTVADGKRVEMGMKCTKEQAECWLITHVEQKVYPYLVKVIVPLNQNQMDALCSFIYNLGGTAFANSTLLKKLNTGDYVGAASELLKWVYDNGKKVAGLVNRRTAERKLFLS